MKLLITTEAVGGVWAYSVGPLPRTTQLAALEPIVDLRTLPCRLYLEAYAALSIAQVVERSIA